MNGKQLSRRVTDPSNGWSCLLASWMLWQLSKGSWMTFSVTCLTSTLLFILTTSSYTWMAPKNIRNTSKKCSVVSNLTVYIANQRNAISTKTLSTILDLFCLKTDLRWTPLKFRSSKIGLEPQKVKDIQSFLGFANFYRCFISNYSDIAIPLTRLTQKGTTWNFSNAARKSFEALKTVFTTAPILTHWIPDKHLIVETDASDYALGVILSL